MLRSIFEISAGAELFAPLQKSRRHHRSYVNKSPIQYGFRAGAKAIWYSVNTS